MGSELSNNKSSTSEKDMDTPRLFVIEPEDLSTVIKIDSSEILVVDVRDEDFEGGNIVGAINVPSESWSKSETISALIEKCTTKKKIIFHCMKSQVRGPSCARMFADALEISSLADKPEVGILRGGFSLWSRRYSSDPSLVENL